MGQVFLGELESGRPVAIKIINERLAGDKEFVERFRREVAAARKVSGIFTASVVEAGLDDNPPWLATSFIAGPSLAQTVADLQVLPSAAVWRLAAGLVEALREIHRFGVVHRDLKPSNILLADDGPRVIDFGISRRFEGTLPSASLMTGPALGTPAYMSPEQVEGQPVGPASDVFSLGSVIAFAATGVAPFRSNSEVAEMHRVLNREPDLSALNDPLRGLVARCLIKDPGARPTLAELTKVIAAESTSYPAVPPGSFWPEPIEAYVRSVHRRLREQAPQVAAPTAPATVPQTGVRPPDPVTGDNRPGPGRPRRRILALIAVAAGVAVVAGATAVVYYATATSHRRLTTAAVRRHAAVCHTPPTVVINAPAAGARVPATVVASGTATCIPRQLRLWLIVRVGQGFYPQAPVILTPGRTGAWMESVTFGGPVPSGQPQSFTLYAVGADTAAARVFATYLRQVTGGQHVPALSLAAGTYPPVQAYASTTVVRPAVAPQVSIGSPRSKLDCRAAAAQCEFVVTGRTAGAPAPAQIFVLVFPIQPAGAGWYIQLATTTVPPNGSWTQAPSFIGAAAFPVHNGDRLQIEAVLVRPGATYQGTPLSVLAARAKPISDPGAIRGLAARSAAVSLRVMR